MKRKRTTRLITLGTVEIATEPNSKVLFGPWWAVKWNLRISDNSWEGYDYERVVAEGPPKLWLTRKEAEKRVRELKYQHGKNLWARVVKIVPEQEGKL